MVIGPGRVNLSFLLVLRAGQLGLHRVHAALRLSGATTCGTMAS